MNSSGEQLRDVLKQCQGAVGYDPLWGELAPVFPFSSPPVRFVVPTSRRADPVRTAEEVIDLLEEDASYAIYLPGTAFDAQGTRHGRGGGWYDRFLAHIPSEWLRIGLCSRENFSRTALERQSWDQPVDWVCVQKGEGMDVYETHARDTHQV